MQVNTLATHAEGITQLTDFIVEPLSGPNVYRVDGANVIQTINGSTSWLIQAMIDLFLQG